MDKIFLKDADGTPQFGCTSCYKCSSIFGKSLCKIKNRGCCWYFPKFTLYDIQKMVRTTEGIETLNMILKLPNVKIYNYYIHAVGSFDKDSYDKYIDDSCTSPLNYASAENNDEFKKYRKERDNYVRWIEWENSSLESILSHNRVNLIDNFDEVISILKETEFDEYEFPSLNEIELA